MELTKKNESDRSVPLNVPSPGPETNADRSEFEQAAEEAPLGLLAEFWLFLREEKKWWMTPILLILLFAGLVAFFTTTGAAPFIYTLF